jgi:hypothetical protein
MTWQPLSPDQMRWAQLLTGIVMSAWIGIGFLPPLRKYANRLRGALLAFYLILCLGFIVAILL